ncbi:MAG: VanZ family protein [Pirellulaceae bacterium]|nr:VanZ family protein [Pirellulaceae bacterium]
MIEFKRKYAISLLIVFWCALFAATHIPGEAFIDLPFTVSDLVAHGVAYFILSVLFLMAIRRPDVSLTTDARRLFVVLGLYAACDELLQIPIPGRYGSWKDWGADILGMVTALIIVFLFYRWQRRRSQSGEKVSESV